MRTYPYTYPAEVVDVHDPMRSGRVKLRIPSVLGEAVSPWALVMLPPNVFASFKEGELVTASFREGNPRYPMVLGKLVPYNGKHHATEFSDWTLEDFQDISRDAKDHAPDEFDNLDHKKGEGHLHPPYWNPNVSGSFWSMGAALFTSEEPGYQRTVWRDRIGQMVRMEGDPSSPKDPHDETRVGGEYTAPDLAPDSVVAKSGWRSVLEMVASHGQRLFFGVKEQPLEEEVELKNQNPDGTHFSRLWFSNSLLSMKSLLERVIPGRTQHYEQVEDPNDPTVDYQKMYDYHGNTIEIGSDNATKNRFLELRTSGGDKVKVYDDVTGDMGVIELQDRAGNKLLIEHMRGYAVVDRITLQHKDGHKVFLDIDKTLLVSNHTGTETILLTPDDMTITSVGGLTIDAPGGVTITSGVPVTINGRAIALNGDPVVTPVGPGTVIGTGV